MSVQTFGFMWADLLHCRFAGQVGYMIAGMKEVKEAQIGDTLFLQKHPVEPLPGFKPAKAMVFAGMYYDYTWLSKRWPVADVQVG